ncbi:winged helix-turn-helix domain-containing protein [Colwelliaceae bacterium 6471]
MTDTKIFYIEEFKIDLSRSVISTNEQEVQVEPKVLKVLHLLARKQNEVVSHQELMEEVWRGAEVVPNALQRCIAILRKELGDNAKSPTIIATHPRIGYRLIAKVRWQTSPATTTNLESEFKTTQIQPSLFAKLFSLGLVFIILSVFWLYNQSKENEVLSLYSQIKLLTQTDAHESDAILSPDGQYILFNRYAGSCKNHIWAKNLGTRQEHQLTKQPGDFSSISFTDNGRELVFAARLHCDFEGNSQVKPYSSNTCWSIATIDFSLSLANPQIPSYRNQCEVDKLTKPVALSNHQYAFLQYQNGNWQLMHYDDLNKKTSALYWSDSIYHFDYNATNKRFAVFARDADLNNVLTLLDRQGNIETRQLINTPAYFSRNQMLKGNFEPDGKYLLAVSNKQLYKIELNGKVEAIQVPVNNLVSAVQKPLSTDLVAIQGHKDVDVAQVLLSENSELKALSDLNSVMLPFKSLGRTKAQERYAKYQPNGDKIAFISDRNGHDQIWLIDNQIDTISPLKSDYFSGPIQGYSWSPNGSHLSWIFNDQLILSDLTGNTQKVTTKRPLYSVLTWFDQKQILVLAHDEMPNGLYLFNLDTKALTPLGINNVEYAWVSNDTLIYSDLMGHVFSRNLAIDNRSNESNLIRGLNGQAMLVHHDSIYGVDFSDFSLNRYTLAGEKIAHITTLKPTAWKISDLREQQLLLSQFIGINQEIVLLK